MGLEVELQTKLNVASWTSGTNRAETSSSDHSRWSPEVGAIESIEHVSLETKIESLVEPELLAQREVPRHQIGSGDYAGTAIPTPGGGRCCKSRRIDPTIRAGISK